jgi:PAS domain S-box-containing protein
MSELAHEIINLQPGDHLCLFYEKDPAEQMPALVPFIQDALTKDEQFIYIADDQTIQQLSERLQSSGINVSDETAKARLKLWTRNEWRQPGELSSERKAAQVREFFNAASAGGFKGIRFAVEMTWTLGPDISAQQLEHWEATINTLLPSNYPSRIICQYNQSRLRPEVLIAGLHTHPLAILGNEVCPNPFYQAPLILDGHANGNGHHDTQTVRARANWMIGQIKQARTVQKQREELIRKESMLAEQRRLGKELRRRAAELEMLFETAALGLRWLAQNGTILWANAAEMEMLGYRPEEYIGHDIREFHVDSEVIESFFTRLNRGSKLVDYEARLRCKDGSIKTVLIDSSVFWEEGRFVHTQCFTRDITGQKRSEKALRAKELQLEAVTNSTPVMIAQCDRNCVYRFVNRAYAERFGLKPEDIIGKSVGEFLGAPAFATLRLHIESVLRGKTAEFEVEIPYRDIGRRQMHVVYVPEKDENGTVIGWVSSIQDISERKRYESALSESELELGAELADSKLLQDLSAEIISEQNIEALYEKLVSAAVAIMRSDFASMQMFYPERGSHGELRLLAFRGFDPDAVKFWEWVSANSTCICGAALRAGQRVIVPDAEKCDFLAGTSDLIAYRQAGIQAMQSTPLLSRSGKLVGMISTHWRQTHQPTERELRLFDILARQAADLIERKHGEDALRQSELRFQAIFNQSGIFAGIMDLAGNLMEVNAIAVDSCGYTREQVLNRPFWETPWWRGSEEMKARVRAATQQAAKGEVFREILHYWFADGTERVVDFAMHPIRDESGVVRFLHPTGIDITERKSGEAAAQRLAAIVESSDDAIIAKDLNGIISNWNKGAERIFGYTADEVIGKPVMILIPPDRYDEEPDILDCIRQGKRIDHYETVRRRKDGELIDISLTISPIKDNSGKIVGASKIAREITVRKRFERQQHALYELVSAVNRAAALPEIYNTSVEAVRRCQNADRAAILLCEDDGVMRFKASHGLSEAYRRAVEGHSPWKPGDLDPQPVWIEDVAKASLDEHLKKVVEAEGIRALVFIPLTYEKRLLGKFMVYYNAPHRFSTEEIRPAQAIASQIVFAIERQRSGETLEKQITERTASLREAITQMEEFSYTVSHDLRAPVRAMHGYAAVLLEDYGEQLDDQARRYLERIVRGGARMDRLIQDVLTYSRLSRREIELQPISLDKLVREILQQYPGLQSARDYVVIDGQLKSVLAHEPLLAQAVSNLLSNAMKFVNPRTEPRIHMRTEQRNGNVRLWVEDNGIGIRPEHQHRLFGMFERLHPEHGYEGTGIGLAIVRKAVERMNGKVGVESDGKTGSSFWIELRTAEKHHEL